MSYVIDGHLRRVTPYYFQYKTNIKQRWIGKTVYDIFESDLGQLRAHIADDIHGHRLQLKTKTDGKQDFLPVAQLSSRPLQQHDIIYNKKHIHEPPVPYNGPVPIIYQDANLVVVNKPSGVPTHPTGNYRLNTVTEIVRAQLQTEVLFACHRLDKATSGVLMLATSSDACSHIQKQLQERDNVHKEYVAKVCGNFPEHLTYRSPIFLLNSTSGYIMPAAKVPLDSTTTFTKLHYDPKDNYSIVSCKPFSGKMHQIRIHLRNLGHPIVNDRLYNPTEDNELDCHRNKIEQKMYLNLDSQLADNRAQFIDVAKACGFNSPEMQQDLDRLRELRKSRLAHLIDHNEICSECQRPVVKSTQTSELWLHAMRYELSLYGQRYQFVADLRLDGFGKVTLSANGNSG